MAMASSDGQAGKTFWAALGRYGVTLRLNSGSIGLAFGLCMIMHFLASLSGLSDAANNLIVFVGCAILTIVLFLARAKTRDFFRLVAMISMAPLAAALGENVWGYGVALIMFGSFIYFLFRPRTVWQTD
jgi:hypothetical protein